MRDVGVGYVTSLDMTVNIVIYKHNTSILCRFEKIKL